MNFNFRKPQPGDQPLEKRIVQLRQQVQSLDPNQMAMRIGAEFFPGNPSLLRIPWWEQDLCLLWPELTPSQDEHTLLQNDTLALLFYHFLISRGAPLSGRWISFSELPDGKFYAQAFQGYSGDLLKARFANDQAAFERSAVSAGGSKTSNSAGLPEAAFAFQPLPRLALLAVMWPGDEDFPASYQVLFDASAPQHLPVDACAILGGMLARRILKAAAAGGDQS